MNNMIEDPTEFDSFLTSLTQVTGDHCLDLPQELKSLLLQPFTQEIVSSSNESSDNDMPATTTSFNSFGSSMSDIGLSSSPPSFGLGSSDESSFPSSPNLSSDDYFRPMQQNGKI